MRPDATPPSGVGSPLSSSGNRRARLAPSQKFVLAFVSVVTLFWIVGGQWAPVWPIALAVGLAIVQALPRDLEP